MNIANELYSSGILTKNRNFGFSGYQLGYTTSERRRWNSSTGHPFMNAFQRIESATKISDEGWQTLKNALR